MRVATLRASSPGRETEEAAGSSFPEGGGIQPRKSRRADRSARVGGGSRPLPSPVGGANAATIEAQVATQNKALLDHRYFRLCRNGELARAQVLDVIKQLYCFSVFFERLLTLRIARYSSTMDARLLTEARKHLREEIGHADLFHRCLTSNGVSAAEVAGLTPKMFTKALFGYLMATVLHEHEYVANVAIMQVMETIGLHFFKATMPVLKTHRMMATAMRLHTEADEHHSKIGLDLAVDFEPPIMDDCCRVIRDLYRLMGYALDEWLTPAEGASPRVAGTA
jgi:pyrroloquinoline quinone (PQQ) biosynthesis protein C